MSARHVLLTLAVYVFWRIEWTQAVPCAPVIDPWTGEPALQQPAVACTETRFKWMGEKFDTRAEADAFVKTKPATGVTNLRVEEYVDPKKGKNK